MDPKQRRPVWHRPSLWLVAIAVGVLGMGVFAAWFVDGDWRSKIMWVLVIVMLVILGVGHGVGARTRREMTWAEQSTVSSMEPQEHRQLMRALRRNDPIPAEQQETAKIVLRQARQASQLNTTTVGVLVVSNVGLVLGNPTPGHRWVQIGFAVISLVLLTVSGWSLIRYRRTARSLHAPEREETADAAG